jgi:hypothetical protein
VSLAIVRLMKPGPETSTRLHRSSSAAWATICVARSRGLPPTRWASLSAPSDWKSACCDRCTTGSAAWPVTAWNALAKRSRRSCSRLSTTCDPCVGDERCWRPGAGYPPVMPRLTASLLRDAPSHRARNGGRHVGSRRTVAYESVCGAAHREAPALQAAWGGDDRDDGRSTAAGSAVVTETRGRSAASAQPWSGSRAGRHCHVPAAGSGPGGSSSSGGRSPTSSR